ncbi:hypothetical protein [Streptomyces sp. URMC 123]|uniref:hypothetical protein n=1 Tax=Streptomyces sp. URMC 123 TaxID=3423403 RepID=UPI003F1C4A43
MTVKNSVRRAVVLGITAGMTAATAVVAGAPTATAEDFGPDTCRQGYVWREARASDRVCVTPATRERTRYDNSRAASRRDPGNGGNGPYACRDGYVWREAFPGDLVCVTPATRSQARRDNQAADSRRVSARLWKSRWYAQPDCDGDTCTAPDGIARIQLNGDHYNFGEVRVVVRRDRDNRVVWSRTVRATAHRGHAGGSFAVRTNLNDCARSGRPANGHARAYDVTSGRWSARIPVTIGCAVL